MVLVADTGQAAWSPGVRSTVGQSGIQGELETYCSESHPLAYDMCSAANQLRKRSAKLE